jgi:eukaryotic-like serine/threonine-protein kinase
MAGNNMASNIATLARDHQPGDVVAGRYVLERKLGEGAMGVVWVAHSKALGVDVALKILRRELAGTSAVERMAREARTAAQLGHPAMVRVMDFDTSEQGEPFLVMELLQGEALNDRLAREQRLHAEQAVALLLPIIDGLGIAQQKGIVHRDIKPENIFIAADQHGRLQPKVLDFGIAKLGREHMGTKLTQAGAILGSPYYLSPEQAEGLDDIDFRCDIWSVGVVLYELVTGNPPFTGKNYNALIRSILSDAPTPLTAPVAGHAELWVLIERCLRKNRDERWGSMWELGEALALWLFERGVRVDAASRSLRHGWFDGELTGLQILVASGPPDARSLRPALTTTLVDGTARAPAAGDGAPARARPRRRSRAGLVAAAAFACLGGASLSALWLGGGKPAQSRAAASTEAEVSRPAAVSKAVVALETAVPRALELPRATPVASLKLPAPRAPRPMSSSTPGATPALTASAETAHARAASRAHAHTEFGF